MFVKALKYIVLLLGGLCHSCISNAQLAVQGQFGEVSFQHSSISADMDTTLNNETLQNRLFPEYNLGLSYKLKNNMEVSFGGGYAHYRSNDLSRSQDPVNGGTLINIDEDYNYLNFQLSIGQAYRINSRFYWLAQAGVWYSSSDHHTWVRLIEDYDQNSRFTGAFSQNRDYPKVRIWGLFVSPGLFFNMTKNLSLGLQLRTGYYWLKEKGADALTQYYYNQSYQLTDTWFLKSAATNFDELHFRYAPFFSLKYEFRP